ncbi:bifunctional 1-(5-phosphoribosyl)-5-((5-phosphoribosylamino)methylideneamino)imidazole-4-carboxamide isomerase/phosphoribosylanthranilate isomerase PriA [Schaalia hyovaginalis]|uniref:bifunctional 1-(5-phosphoribosyl)-5-((5- phosphoribosylamino)methylideneamino)imidazole-4- carboxamide isomerase/phosphoribosylanthranilate isomerase PriA n=2 Tax=Schaalia hyovaginalis TaxID=29316 RepID=UPI0026E9FEBC|nr:bifunctional 1-(5-phosphoribosyl)-5-((5-phosphoribosylamino)methylideneamino)imidazole-4-carboxamide isomerase/phosphoribosylanthranilate isomerase PriA [Schaalia hyovaginalis]MCI6410571.1 bifunctional 1-(5-phosphoribosyl)-5-((5-phosphoribosylamino)methylideneamino)imidazole-4-carboxamide isomerase/phosphoribosylanthranilate isomerase PriA [Schaalia hyovaginalis]MDD7553150.1 bifunctional 1-(5-phosphoribosyl)-5-((5-phosphoribosylamino)methylideneamino)imidazole-4-carboxamide isomerase/phosphori
MSRLILLPAVDVVDGKAVRLTRGEAGTETDYGHPLEAARSFAEAGAQWLHLVDLDAAFGRGSNAPLLMEITKELPINVELSGGIRDDASLARALDAGARRVNLGTAALEDPEWTEAVIKEFGDRIAVGLDVRGETLSARGWTRDGGNLFETIERLNEAGCVRYVVTDVARDGMLSGPNVELLARVCQATDAAVVASGGVSSLADIAALRELVDAGVEGAIVGKALYAGAFTLAEALAVASGESAK